MDHILEIDKISSFYGPIQALEDVSISVKKGSIVSLIGANGAGKSTLLMSIFGSPRAKKGSIVFDGKNITDYEMHDIAKLGIAQVPEGRRIFGGMTVEENLKTGTIPIGDKYMDEDLDHVYELFPRLAERKSQRAGTMSGGEQQMLAIARALMSRPKLLLLDEPSLGLAPLIVKQIFEIIEKIASEGATIFLVEQNANLALKIADQAYVLVNGKISMTGTGKELLGNPQIREAYLGH
ncbi:ABC transporter ATP-binding protein [bacterium]|nr:ABC transporter ATP-binding protein [bacterium]